MAIVAADIKYYLSGGSGNSNPNASLGGAISTTEVGTGLQNIFDNVSGAENSAGDTEYRCIYVKNTHGTLTSIGSIMWIETNTPSTDSSVEIGLGSSAISGTEQTVANEGTAPTGITFTASTGVGNAYTIGDLAPGATKAVWFKRVINTGGAAYNADTFQFRFRGETGA